MACALPGKLLYAILGRSWTIAIPAGLFRRPLVEKAHFAIPAPSTY